MTTVVLMLWAIVFIALGWGISTQHEYRPGPPPRVIREDTIMCVGVAEYVGGHRAPDDDDAQPLEWVAVGIARVPAMSRVTMALVAPYDGMGGTTVIRTRIKRHAIDGPSHYNSREHPILMIGSNA